MLGVDDGALLILHEAAGAAPPASDRARTFPAQPATALVAPQRVCERRLSDRTARTPPVKLSRPARCAMALRAAAHNSSRMNRPCRVRRAGPARPRSLGAHGTRRCRGLELPGRRPAPGTGWIRSFVAPRLRHCVTSVKGRSRTITKHLQIGHKVECTTWRTKRGGSGTDGPKTERSQITNVLRVSRA